MHWTKQDVSLLYTCLRVGHRQNIKNLAFYDIMLKNDCFAKHITLKEVFNIYNTISYDHIIIYVICCCLKQNTVIVAL